MWKYNNFISISKDFIPVFTEEVDKNYKGTWKFFIPHSHMKNMLEKLTTALERSNVGDKRSLWLTGAYGTGKTYASFVVKHLLEDSVEEIENYFNKHKIISPLWHRVKALREGNPYLVVYRSAAGHITSSRRLMMEFQQAIKEELKAQGYSKTFGESILDQLVSKLSGPENIFNWEGAFKKYRGRFRTVSSPEEVISLLQAGDISLGAVVAEVLEEEGISLIDSPRAIKQWLKEIIETNDLRGIIFIWDEFTEFFYNNVPVTPLQELAHATTDMPFYLFLVTHRALNQFTRIDDDTRKKLIDRFHTCQLEMAPVTAYKLIANAVDSKKENINEWEAKRDSLWNAVSSLVNRLALTGDQMSKDDLRKLAPIHPYTANLLSTISSLYSSSQRTLFQFLKKDEPGSFQWFIANYPKDNWYWLTPDYLWQYFFEETKLEAIDNVGDLINHYKVADEKLSDEEERRVLRVMLLLVALNRQTHESSELLKPRLSIIKQMFLGTGLAPKVEDVAKKLCADNIMHEIKTGNDYEYIVPIANIDHDKLKQCRQRIQSSMPFEKLLNIKSQDAEFGLALKNILLLQGSAKLRHPLQIISAQDLKKKKGRFVSIVENPYEIGVVLVVAQQDEDLIDSEMIAKELSLEYSDHILLISQVPFGQKRWNDWVEHRAYWLYHEETRNETIKRFYENKSKNLMAEWIDGVRRGRVRGFFKGEQTELTNCNAISNYLESIVEKVFPYGPEVLSKTGTLYTSNWGKAGAEIGLKSASIVQQPYKEVVLLLERQGVWDQNGLSRYPNHPMAKMKSIVDKYFSSHDQVKIIDLWCALTNKPYGLMPSPIGILLFSFLLRDYANGYYYSDGINSLPLNPNKLAELIVQVLKGNSNQSELINIRKMSVAGEKFCKLSRNIFRLSEKKTSFPEDALKNARDTVISLGYPLWALSYFLKDTYDIAPSAKIVESIKVLFDVLGYDHELDDEAMNNVVNAVHPFHKELNSLLCADNLQKGMIAFWQAEKPELITLIRKLDVDVTHVMNILRNHLNQDPYLWTEDKVKDKLSKVVQELDLLDAFNELLETRKHSMEELKVYFRTSWLTGKFPLQAFKASQSEATVKVLDGLNEVIYKESKSIPDSLSDDLRKNRDYLQSLLENPILLLTRLVESYTGHKLTDSEAQDIYKQLPDLTSSTSEEMKRSILQILSQRSKHKKIVKLRALWKELTDSDSPDNWSERRQIPIHWVLDDGDCHKLFEKFNHLDAMQEEQIDRMLSYLIDKKEELAVLKNDQFVKNRFILAVAGEYADLVYQTGESDKLQVYISKNMEVPVPLWPMKISEIKRLVHNWVTRNYKEIVYPRVAEVLRAAPAEKIKSVVHDLVAEDALVGARLIAALKQNER